MTRRAAALAALSIAAAAPPRVAAEPLSVTAAAPWGTVQLDAFGCGIRVRVAPPGAPIADARVRALLPAAPPPCAAARGARGAPALTVGDLAASVDAATGAVAFSLASSGAPLLSLLNVSFGAAPKSARAGAVSARVALSGLAPGERVYGLGEHAAAGVGLTSFYSRWEHENNGVLTIPWLASSRGYGFLHNVPGFGTVNVSPEAHVWTANATLNADFWVTAPPPPASADDLPLAGIMRHYADAVGHAPPMPFAASGFWQSKNRYRNQSQLLAVAHGFRDRALPLAVIVIDYLSWPALGDDFFTPACWPDPGQMVAELRAMGVEVVVSWYPYQNTDSVNYGKLVGLSAVDMRGRNNSYGGCLGGQTLYDAFNPAARAASFDLWTAGYGVHGVSWAWEDCSEPGRDASLNGNWRYSAGTDTEIGAAWTREHARTLAEGNARRGLNASSYVTLSRAAYPGSSALSAALWSGDVETNFATLAAQVRVAQQASMSGVALWASDTGGTFIASDAAPARRARNCDPNDPKTQPYARPRP